MDLVDLLFLRSGPHAYYVDPGAGSILLQLILGGVAGLAIVGKLFWYRLRGIFGFAPRDQSDDDPAVNEPEEKP